MTSHRCESCGGTGMAPVTSPVYACQFCGGHGWVVDRMTSPAPASSIPIPKSA